MAPQVQGVLLGVQRRRGGWGGCHTWVAWGKSSGAAGNWGAGGNQARNGETGRNQAVIERQNLPDPSLIVRGKQKGEGNREERGKKEREVKNSRRRCGSPARQRRASPVTPRVSACSLRGHSHMRLRLLCTSVQTRLCWSTALCALTSMCLLCLSVAPCGPLQYCTGQAPSISNLLEFHSSCSAARASLP